MTEATTTTAQNPKTEEAVPELMPDPITFTDAAVAKVKELMDEEGNPNLKLFSCRAAAAPASSTALRSMKRRTRTMP